MLTQIISGSDPNNSTSVSRLKRDYLTELESKIKGLKIGVLTTYASCVYIFLALINPEVMRGMEKTLAVFKAAGSKLVTLVIPYGFKNM